MKIDKLRKEFNLNLPKNNLKNSYDFDNNKKSKSKDKIQPQIQTQLKTNANKLILLYNASNKLFQKVPKCDLIQAKAFNSNNITNHKNQPPIPQSKSSYLTHNKEFTSSYDTKIKNKQELHLQISNSLKLFHNSSNQHYNTISVWPKESNQIDQTSKQSTIQQKDSLITKLNEQLSLKYIKIGELESQIQYLNEKYSKVKDERNNLQSKSLTYQNDLFKLKGENEALKQHQLKLMKVIYIIKDKGIDIDSVINCVFQAKGNGYFNSNYYNNTNNRDDSIVNDSLDYINFPDKIHTMVNEDDLNVIPRLDFNKVYLYQSACIEQEDYIKNNNNNKHNDYYHYQKVNDYQNQNSNYYQYNDNKGYKCHKTEEGIIKQNRITLINDKSSIDNNSEYTYSKEKYKPKNNRIILKKK